MKQFNIKMSSRIAVAVALLAMASTAAMASTYIQVIGSSAAVATRNLVTDGGIKCGPAYSITGITHWITSTANGALFHAGGTLTCYKN